VVTNRKQGHRRGKIQLIDARERWSPMKRSLGDKRRLLDQAAVDTITREHGAFEDSPTSRLFDNDDFGYRRISVLRPLRLRFEITPEARERFLDTCPELFDALQMVEEVFGSEPQLDWNDTWEEVQGLLKRVPRGIEGWTKGPKGTAQKKIFRDCFTSVDPESAPVIAKQHKTLMLRRDDLFPNQTLPDDLSQEQLYALLGLHADGEGGFIEYEADSNLKDAESIPLKEDIITYMQREVLPYVADAWIDRETVDETDSGIGKVGYEINFNRVFFQYQPPRPLEEIDAELADVEKKILDLLGEMTK
jgi:type I restriction enzyme M protein